MNWEEAIALVTREATSERLQYGVIVFLGLIVCYLGLVTWRAREQTRMNAEREKVAKSLAAQHIFGALQYAVKDGDLTAAEAAQIIRDIGKRVLPDLLPEGVTLKEELQAKKGVVKAIVDKSILSLVKFKA